MEEDKQEGKEGVGRRARKEELDEEEREILKCLARYEGLRQEDEHDERKLEWEEVSPS